MFSVSWRWVLLCRGRTSILFLHMENQYWTMAHVNCHCGIGGRRTLASNQSPGKLADLLVVEMDRSVHVRVTEIERFSHFQSRRILGKVKVCAVLNFNQGAAVCHWERCMWRLDESALSLWGALSTLTTGAALNKLHMFSVLLLSVGWWQTHSAPSSFTPPELIEGFECFILTVGVCVGQRRWLKTSIALPARP